MDYTTHLYQGGLLEQYDGTSSTGTTFKYDVAIHEVEDEVAYYRNHQDQFNYKIQSTNSGAGGQLYEENAENGED